jgi:cytochrome oxidase Cu insertion factor (SCO1/SenC/PrrC family)
MIWSKKISLNALFCLVFLLAAAFPAAALQVGDKAPDFELDSSKGGKIKLSSLKGKNVLINFYVLDFSPT